MLAGDRALSRGDYDAAAGCFRRALETQPNNLDALQGLAVALVAAGQYEAAVPVYRAIVATAPRGPSGAPGPAGRTAGFNLAVALMRLRRLDQAEDVLRRLLADDADDLRARFNLATVCQAQGKLASARDEWRSVVGSRAPLAAADAAFAHASLGEVLMGLDQPEEAMAAFGAAAGLDAADPAAWVNLAAAAEAAGRPGRAAAAARRAVELLPSDAAAWARMGDLLLTLHRASGRRGFLAEAVEAWRKSLSLDPGRKEVSERLRMYERALAPAEAPATQTGS